MLCVWFEVGVSFGLVVVCLCDGVVEFWLLCGIVCVDGEGCFVGY